MTPESAREILNAAGECVYFPCAGTVELDGVFTSLEIEAVLALLRSGEKSADWRKP